MLTYRLPGVPRPIEPDEPEVIWHWEPSEGDGPTSPWGGPTRRPQRPVSWIPPTGVPTDCFTYEVWLRPGVELTSADHPIVVTSCNYRGTAWVFEITRHLKPRIRWLDGGGTTQTSTGDSLVDLLDPARWLHVAIVHHGPSSDLADPSLDYVRWAVYVTPAGEAWPRLVLHETGARANLPGSSGCVNLMPGPFQYAQAACSNHAKLPNEFGTLGQTAPADVSFDATLPGGSCRAPLAVGPREVVAGCTPGVTDANYWFHSQVTLADPADPTPLSLTLLATPKGQAMLNTLFRSVDGEHWERLPGSWFASDRGHVAQGFLRVEVPADAPRFALAAAPPYGLNDVERLLADLGGHPWVTVLELGQSVRGRPIRGLRLSAADASAGGLDRVWLQAGQHSPLEQATGRVLDVLARRLVADESYRAFLASHEVYLVPLVNTDSAALGEAGVNQHRLNLNRYWLGRSVPETAGIRALLDDLAGRPGRMRIALDLHAGGTWGHHVALYLGRDRAGAVCPPGWDLQVARWLEHLERHTGIAREDAFESSEGLNHFAPAVAVKYGWPAITLEFSFATWRDVDGTVKPVTQESLALCGARLADCLAEFVRD